MSKYVMSDLHGEYNRFFKMLELINFKDTDTLYILGDVFDRGNKPLEIIDYIVAHKNIVLLKGNHEKMFEEAFELDDYSLWYYNGGQTTHEEILKRNWTYEESLYHYINKLKLIEVVDNEFILSHAGIMLPNKYEDMSLNEILEKQTEDILLWNRKTLNNEVQYKNYKIICGHTPTCLIDETLTECKILNKNNTIYIDCGACFTKDNRCSLGCLRLDDMKEFYVK